MIGTIVGYGIVIIIGLVVLFFIIGIFANIVNKIKKLKQEGELSKLIVVELISIIVFVVSLIQWNRTPYGFWSFPTLLSPMFMIGFFFLYSSEFKRDENEPNSNEVDSLFDNLNMQKNQSFSVSSWKSNNNSTQTNQSYARNQQMASSSWMIQSEPSNSWSEYNKEKKNYSKQKEKNITFIKDKLKQILAEFLELDQKNSVLEETFNNSFPIYTKNEGLTDGLTMEQILSNPKFMGFYIERLKTLFTHFFHIDENALNNITENDSISSVARLLEPYMTYTPYLDESNKGKKMFGLLDEMYDAITRIDLTNISDSVKNILQTKPSSSESVRQILKYAFVYDINYLSQEFSSNLEMERLWQGFRQYLFVEKECPWIKIIGTYDVSPLYWKGLLDACIKENVSAALCEHLYDENKFGFSSDDLNPATLLLQRNGIMIFLALISGKKSKIIQDYGNLRTLFVKELANFNGKVSYKDEKMMDEIFTEMDKIFELDTRGSKANNAEILQNAINTLNSMIGLDSVKHEVLSLKNIVEMQRRQSEQGLSVVPMSYHCVFTGNPGTGKTTVARIIAQIYKGLGILKKGHLVECDRSSLVAGYVGQTAIKTNEVVDKALDGVLFIDEAYALAKDRDSFGQEAIDTLLKRMEDDRNRLVVIVAGYTNEMKTFIDSNPGLKSRFNRYIEFEDYSAEEMLTIFKNLATKQKYTLSEESEKILLGIFKDVKESEDNSFGNARGVRNLFEKVLINQANRIAKNGCVGPESQILVPEDFEDGRPKKIKKIDAMAQLTSMIGLQSVKQEVLTLRNIVVAQKKRAAAGLPVLPMSYHCVFTGNPGTGKTSVARIVAEIYKDLGVLRKGHLVECDRSSLVAGYVGQTAIKTNEIIDKALDGVLFIDEAYTLIKDRDSFGQEAIDTLLKRMEDDRKRLVVIVAGYTNEMKNFIESNPGLKSRFNRYIEFEDYTEDELVALFKKLAEEQKFVLSDGFEKQLRLTLRNILSENIASFGNGRGIRNLFEKTVLKQANRLAMTDDNVDMQKLEPEDLPI